MRRVGAHLVHVSTDYVFDGTLDRPYHEWDRPNPSGVYGASKLAGEREALVLGASAAVVRTSWVCGEHGSNMVRTVLRLLADGDDTPGRWRSSTTSAAVRRSPPTSPRCCAGSPSTAARGVHHVTNQGAVTWYEFAQAVVTAAGRDPAIVRPITTAELDPPRPAPRPANSVLDNAVLRAAGIPLLRDFREPLAELVAALAR